VRRPNWSPLIRSRFDAVSALGGQLTPSRRWADHIFPQWAAHRRVGRAFAASIGRSFKACACPRKDFRAAFFLRKFFRNSVSFNVRRRAFIRGHRDAGNKLQVFRCRNRAARKPDPAARQIRATRVAFSLPQDSSAQLMFETCVNCRSSLSAFGDVGFRGERCIMLSARRLQCIASD
jgi:hypothetical protein